MSATLTVRHTVADYETWRVAYDEADAIRKKHGCTAQQYIARPGIPTTSSSRTTSRRVAGRGVRR